MMQRAKNKAFFIAGTDTEIGKTFVACALLKAYAQLGWKTVGMKPVAAGAICMDGHWHNEDVDALDEASTEHPDLAWRCPYLLKTPAAPHVVAALENVSIKPEVIITRLALLREVAQVVIVEGVGGLRVPLSATYDTADLAVALGLPVILVVGLRLGCINQALLTHEAMRTRGLQVMGWVANSTQQTMPFEAENIAAIQERMNVPLLGHIPYLAHGQVSQASSYLTLPKLV